MQVQDKLHFWADAKKRETSRRSVVNKKDRLHRNGGLAPGSRGFFGLAIKGWRLGVDVSIFRGSKWYRTSQGTRSPRRNRHTLCSRAGPRCAGGYLLTLIGSRRRHLSIARRGTSPRGRRPCHRVGLGVCAVRPAWLCYFLPSLPNSARRVQMRLGLAK